MIVVLTGETQKSKLMFFSTHVTPIRP